MRKWGFIFVGLVVLALMTFVLLSPSSGDSAKNSAEARLSRTLLEDQDPLVRRAAALALGKTGDRNVVDALLAALQKDESVMPEVAQALAALGVKYEDIRSQQAVQLPGWLESLKAWVLSVSLTNAIWFVLALAFVYTVFEVLNVWWTRHLRGKELIWRGFKLAIGSTTILVIGAGAVYLGMGSLPSRQPNVDLKSVDLLGIELARQTKDRTTVPWLLGLLRDSARPSEIRWRAAQALGVISDRASSEGLLVAAGDPDPRIRLYATWAIGNIFVAKDEQRENGIAENDIGPRALQQLNDAIAQRPAGSTAYLRRSRLLASEGHYQAALADLDRAYALSVTHRSEICRDRGVLLTLLGRSDDAIEQYSKAINQSPDLQSAYHLRGLALASLRKYDEALKDLTAALDLTPEDFDALLARGDIYLEIGNNQRAAEDYKRCEPLAKTQIDKEAIRGRLETLSGGRPKLLEPMSLYPLLEIPGKPIKPEQAGK